MEGKRSRHNIWVSARIACKAAMNVIQEILFEGLDLNPEPAVYEAWTACSTMLTPWPAHNNYTKPVWIHVHDNISVKYRNFQR
jgi:hypothetical protein